MESVGGLGYDGSDAQVLGIELRERNRELAALNAIARSINHRLDLHAILKHCLNETETLVAYEWAGVALLDEVEPDRAVVAVSSGRMEALQQGVIFVTKDTLLEESLISKRPAVVSDLTRRQDQVSTQLIQQGLRCCVVVPLIDEDRAVGAFLLARTGADGFLPGQIRILEAVASHLSVAVCNARLYESVRTRTLELEALTREMQHRVQNNLQMITGLVGMIKTDSPASRRSVAKCLGQIKAISIIHEMLCCDRETGSVGLKETIDRVARMAVLAASGGKRISVEIRGDEVCLPSRYASAAVIAVNELVSNAIEHGFGDRDSGHITIGLMSNARRTEISVRDDGTGLPQGFAIDETGKSGLSVLCMLLRQGLGGSLDIKSDFGTVAKISFSI